MSTILFLREYAIDLELKIKNKENEVLGIDEHLKEERKRLSDLKNALEDTKESIKKLEL